MAKKDKLIWGIILIFIGLVVVLPLGILGFPSNVSLFFGWPLIIVGIVIILNKSEDTIEKRKDIR